jgi:hypothetical protein
MSAASSIAWLKPFSPPVADQGKQGSRTGSVWLQRGKQQQSLEADWVDISSKNLLISRFSCTDPSNTDKYTTNTQSNSCRSTKSNIIA